MQFYPLQLSTTEYKWDAKNYIKNRIKWCHIFEIPPPPTFLSQNITFWEPPPPIESDILCEWPLTLSIKFCNFRTNIYFLNFTSISRALLVSDNVIMIYIPFNKYSLWHHHYMLKHVQVEKYTDDDRDTIELVISHCPLEGFTSAIKQFEISPNLVQTFLINISSIKIPFSAWLEEGKPAERTSWKMKWINRKIFWPV